MTIEQRTVAFLIGWLLCGVISIFLTRRASWGIFGRAPSPVLHLFDLIGGPVMIGIYFSVYHPHLLDRDPDEEFVDPEEEFDRFKMEMRVSRRFYARIREEEDQ